MTTESTNEALARALEDLRQRALDLSEDFGADVEAAVRLADEAPLDNERAERLWTAILVRLESRGADLSEEGRSSLADEVQQQVRAIVDSVQRDASSNEIRNRDSDGGIVLIERYGLAPRDVRPLPTFNGQTIQMQEGYVDVRDLSLWHGNHRVNLHVQEFLARNDRRPSDSELLLMMHGKLALPSLDHDDPFHIRGLAGSIARKGVERPPIVTHDGEPKDGNRRIAASMFVLEHPNEFSLEERERAQWIRVWKAPAGTTEDQFEAIVVALNFEEDFKEPWPEYVKARLVTERYHAIREGYQGRFTESQNRDVKREVAKQFAIKTHEVTRYLKMVQWADDFEDYHTVEAGRDESEVRYKANDIFQWFYEIDAGKGSLKLTSQLDKDPNLRPVVYDLMFEVLDSGAQVRSLHKVVADDEALPLLLKAHESATEDRTHALELVKESISDAGRRNVARRRLGFEQFVKSVIDRLGTAPPEQWTNVESELLISLHRVLSGTLGAVDGVLTSRGILPKQANE